MSSSFYVNKYGANNHTFLDSSGNIWNNNFVGAMLNYNKVDLGSEGYLFENGLGATHSSTGLTPDDFTSFYDTYKTIVGSDIMSYTNKYSNTTNMAMGDMMNWGTKTPGNMSYTNNLSANSSDFYYRQTKDGDPYRYTESGTGDEMVGGYNSSANNGFTMLQNSYQTYYDYKIAHFDGKTANLSSVSSAVDLTALGLDYSSVMSQSGVSADNVASVYQNLVNQLVSELKAIKPSTISETDKIAMEKTLDEKQSSLKAIDDALFGYASASPITTGGGFLAYQAQFAFAGATPNASVETASKNGISNDYKLLSMVSVPSNAGFTTYATYAALVAAAPANGTYCIGSGSPYSKVTVVKNSAPPSNITTAMYNAIGSIAATGAAAADAKTSFQDQVKTAITQYIYDNPTSALQAIDFSPVTSPTANVRVNVLNVIFGTDDANADGIENDPVAADPTILAAYNSLPAASIITKSDIISFVNTYFPTLPAADKADSIETLFTNKMLEKYTNQITAAIMSSVIDTDTNPDDTTGSLIKLTEAITTSVPNEISARVNDSNSSTPMAIRHLKAGYNDTATQNALVKELGDSIYNAGAVVGTNITQTVTEWKMTRTPSFWRSSKWGWVTTTKEISAAPTDSQKQEASAYLGEVTAGIMEQYWIENFNNPKAEAFTDYFNREFRAYLNPDGYSGYKQMQYVASDGTTKAVNLDFNEDPAVTNTVDRIMQTQAFAQIYSKMEDRSRAEMELFEASSALDVVQNVNTQEYLYRLNMLASLEKLTDGNNNLKGKVDFSGVTRNLVELGPGASKNPWWEEYFPWFKGFYGNLPDGATAADMFDANGNIKAAMVGSNGNLIDPYVVNINGVDYVMGVDDNKDGKINGAKEILGINDTKDQSFTSLKALDLNGDGIISQAEMQEKGIIFEAMNASDRLNGAQIKTDFINSIDLASLQNADGTNGVFGNFEVKLANGKKAGGIQTFETQDYFNNLFGTYVDMSFLSQTPTATPTPIAAPTAAPTPTPTAAPTAAPIPTPTTAPTAAPILTPNKFDLNAIQAQQFKVFSYLDNTATTQNQTTQFDLNAIQAKQFNFFSYLDTTSTTDTTTEAAAAQAAATQAAATQAAATQAAATQAAATQAAATQAAATQAAAAQAIIKPIALDVNQQPVIIVSNKEMTVDALVNNICWKMNITKLTVKQRYDILGSIDTSQSSEVIIKKIEEKLAKTQFSA